MTSVTAWSRMREAEVELVVADGERRGDAGNAAHAGQVHDVHGQPELEAAPVIAAPSSGAGLREARSATISTPSEQPPAADVADALVAIL